MWKTSPCHNTLKKQEGHHHHTVAAHLPGFLPASPPGCCPTDFIGSPLFFFYFLFLLSFSFSFFSFFLDFVSFTFVS
jgi:hypothetical protein